jgi:hypothetical protein
MLFFASPGEKQHTRKHLGLSLADDFSILCVSFFAPEGRKTTHNKDKVPCCRRLK